MKKPPFRYLSYGNVAVNWNNPLAPVLYWSPQQRDWVEAPVRTEQTSYYVGVALRLVKAYLDAPHSGKWRSLIPPRQGRPPEYPLPPKCDRILDGDPLLAVCLDDPDAPVYWFDGVRWVRTSLQTGSKQAREIRREFEAVHRK